MSTTRSPQDQLAALAAPLPSLVVASSRGEFFAHGYADVSKSTSPQASTAYGIGSTSKVFAALTCMRLVSDGLLALHDPVTAVLGDHPLLTDVTCHHLLSHTAGIPPLHSRFAALAEGPVPDRTGGTGAIPDWARQLDRVPGVDFRDGAGLLDYLMHFRIRRLAAPGRVFSYSNEGYVLLAAVIAKVAGTTYEDVCAEAVIEPLGLTSTAFLGSNQAAQLPDVATPYLRGGGDLAPTNWWVSPAWSAPGGMLSSARDLLTVAAAIQTRTVPEIGSGYVQAMCAPQAQRAGGGFYGYGVAGQQAASGLILGHAGARVGSSSALYWTKQRPRAAVGLSNVLGAPVGLAAQCLLGAAPRRPARPSQIPLPLDLLPLDLLVGTYWTGEGGALSFEVGDSGPQLNYLGQTVPVTAVTSARFVSTDGAVQADFLVDGAQPAWGVCFGDRVLTRRKAINPWPLGPS
jgi:CubicO group peptidase (beta-lactamase class C family)